MIVLNMNNHNSLNKRDFFQEYRQVYGDASGKPMCEKAFGKGENTARGAVLCHGQDTAGHCGYK